MNELNEHLEEMCLRGELFDYCLSEFSAMLLTNNYTYNGKYITQSNTIFDSKVEEWILENIGKVYINPDYHNSENGYYGDDDDYTSNIVILYFSSKEDLMAFILRWA